MIPPQIPERILVQPQAIRNSIELDKATLAQREKVLHWVKMKAAAERDLISEIAPFIGVQSDISRNALHRWLEAQKKFTEAQCEIEETGVLELRGRIQIQEKILEEALAGGKKIVVPPGGMV